MDEKQTPSPKTESMTMVNAPSRKQNVACDACRSRKVKCLQVPGQAKCQHCLVKKLECRHLIQQATSEKRRVVGTRRSKASPSENSSKYPSVFPSTTTGLPAAPQVVVDPLYQYSAQSKPPFGSTRQRSNPTIQLVDWLFSPPDTTVVIPPFVGGAESAGYRNFAIRSKIPVTGHTDTDWEDLRSHLEPDEARTELANDLVEVYFQICQSVSVLFQQAPYGFTGHNRLPLLDSNDFRTRLRAYLYPTSTLDPNVLPLPPSLLVTVIAWGAKFSEHPLLVHDRAMNAGKSRLSRLITKRAREVAEGEKVHRVPSCDNVIIALLLEPLHSHNPSDLDGNSSGLGLAKLTEYEFRSQWLLAELRSTAFIRDGDKPDSPITRARRAFSCNDGVCLVYGVYL
ncbi:hypothetical protein FRC15_002745 [Serendipita sp. 397]|nr:hypothetical protein FRC15_002745 [Serendipita sp. 397]